MSEAPHAAHLRFSKMQGAGNDFVVLDLRDGTPPPDAALAVRLADRHFGVGCDQILTIEAPRDAAAVASYRIWNTDGSAAGQCGNGARCVAAWLVRDGSAPAADTFVIESPAGSHHITRSATGEFAVAMGVPRFAPEEVPLVGFPRARDEYVLPLQGGSVRFGAVSMGNPHAVLEVGLVDAAPVERLGPLLQQHASFPDSVNVGFVQVIDRGHLRLRVYERGVGETLACGSGACAAAAVMMQRGRVERDVRVSLPGGELRVQWPDDSAQVVMSGPATFVFDGEWIR
ncbi:diaminopimelate epimerase [Xanthomonas sp. A2111]|uniref:Diaminopimelate epimerase n=1 Tax=Xanthomonas hawaiiensis TaxID=3003247 RepID=A0ABU2I6W9_9XANT|nr:diaminopimelate epimerase [Xanthomonas sp. A2111]MBO9829339.1 diaminopimelate epimerase [Xanthomonas sp. A2111]MDS9993900.1 diaminopimelate epimerase [Xanthomonas sp. A2111]